MGVRGLTSFIEKHSELYLENYKLQNSYLVIDGNNIASHIYQWVSKSNSAFGGDYDEYSYQVFNFFISLKKCNVTPIVILDGGHESKKVPTVISRFKSNLSRVKNVQHILSGVPSFPIFMQQTFNDVLQDLKIVHVQCDFEADNEIATIARFLQCPVLSYDSDFYIYDVLYIPFSKLHMDPVKVENDLEITYYMKCCLYDVKNFLSSFPGLEISMLPLLSTLLGNDYINNKIFDNFFANIKISKSGHEKHTQKRIMSILNWLQNETTETAVPKILKHLKKKDADFILLQIQQSVAAYNSVGSHVLKVVNDKFEIHGFVNESLQKFSAFVELSRQCKVPSFVIDMIYLKCYFLYPQVEDLSIESSHDISLPIVKLIFEILHIGMKEMFSFVLYTRCKGVMEKRVMTPEPLFFSMFTCFDELISQDVHIRRNLMFEALDFLENDIEVVNIFPNEWQLYVASIIYWSQKENDLTIVHVSALLWTLIGSWFINKRIGFYKKKSKFLSHNAGIINRVQKKRKNQVEYTQENSSDIQESDLQHLVDSITEDDCLLLGELFITMHEVDEKLKSKKTKFDQNVVHKFAKFQSCVFHYSCLNSLLNFPLTKLKISDFYSGSVLYNSYSLLKSKKNMHEYTQNVFRSTPSFLLLYNRLLLVLGKYFPKKTVFKKKTTKRKSKSETVYLPVEDKELDGQYTCADNKFALLSSLE